MSSGPTCLGAIDDAAADKAGEADPLKFNDDGANAIEQRIKQIFLPLVTQ